jgi:hypothetical protein
MSEPTPLAIVRSSEDLRELFRRRVAELNISLETLDEISVDPTRQFGAISFSALLGALALQLVAMEDAEALARVQRRLVPLQGKSIQGWRAEYSASTRCLSPLLPR